MSSFRRCYDRQRWSCDLDRILDRRSTECGVTAGLTDLYPTETRGRISFLAGPTDATELLDLKLIEQREMPSFCAALVIISRSFFIQSQTQRFQLRIDDNERHRLDVAAFDIASMNEQTRTAKDCFCVRLG